MATVFRSLNRLIRSVPLDPEAEIAFKKQFRLRSFEITTVILIIAAFSGSALSLLAYFRYGESDVSTQELAIRIALSWVAPGALLALRSRAEEWYPWIVFLSLLILVGRRYADYSHQLLGTSLSPNKNQHLLDQLHLLAVSVTIYITVLLQLPFRFAAGLALANAVLYATLLASSQTVSVVFYPVSRLIVWIFFGLFVCWVIQSRERHLFFSEREAQAEKIKATQLAEQYIAARDAAIHEISNLRRDAELERSKRLKFIRDILHDIRGPLGTLGLCINTYRDATTKGREDIAQQAAKTLRRTYNTVSQLANDLFEMSDHESGRFKYEIRAIQVNEMLQDLASSVSERVNAKGLRLLLEEPKDQLLCSSDKTALYRVLGNLLSNAIKFTPTQPNQAALITLGATQEIGFVTIYVNDSGVGIDSDRANLIWEYGETTVGTADEEGHGIGLAVIKTICDALGHDITFRSIKGQGTCFYLRVPLADNLSFQNESTFGGYSISSLAKLTVLVVDDHLDTLQANALLVALVGAEPILIDGLSDIYKMMQLSTTVPQLIITDFHLRNGEKGTDIIVETRRIFGSSIPAIIVTADKNAAIEAMGDLRFVKVIEKPLEEERLLTTAGELLATSSM